MSNTIFFIVLFFEIKWKNILEPDDNTAHAHCLLDT